MHVEFRVRTVCELALHQDYYLQPSVVSFCDNHTEISKNVLLATSANYEQATQLSTQHCYICPNPLIVCFQLDCCDTCKDGNYSNMWHVHGLATVFGQTIMSLYPDINARIRRAYHKKVVPRVTHSSKPSEPFLILWTRASPRPLDDKWQPNHFVPCTLPCEVVPTTNKVCVHKSQQDAGDNSNKGESTATLKVHLSEHHKNPCSTSNKPVGGIQFQCQQGKAPKPQSPPDADYPTCTSTTTTQLPPRPSESSTLSTVTDTSQSNPYSTSNKPVGGTQFQCQQAEQPSSPMVQMCLPRLLHFLNLEKVTQVSFAEYHSKRNFVERVHAEENSVI